MNPYHTPVMLAECVQALDIQPDRAYVDVTFGGGGHSKVILSRLQGTSKLYAFDQDDEAVANAVSLKSNAFVMIQANFRYLKKYLRLNGCKQVHGILADLGVSSHQIDEAERGFSTRFDGVLDMRMDRTKDFTAKELVNSYPISELHRILGMYGEVKNAKTLAEAIGTARSQKTIEKVSDLKAILQRFAPKGKEFKYFAQVFQALRIEVNDELKALEEFLIEATDVLAVGGRLVVLTYHSLEDRIVKNYINKGKFHGEVEKDLYGNEIKPLQAVYKKPLEASEEEIQINSRSRSAKLRVAEKL